MTDGLAIAPDRRQKPAEIERHRIGAGSAETPRNEHQITGPYLAYVL